MSLALRNHPRLPLETRERIRSLAEKMGYRPDPFLRALVAYRGKMMPRRNPPMARPVPSAAARLEVQVPCAKGNTHRHALDALELPVVKAEISTFLAGLLGPRP